MTVDVSIIAVGEMSVSFAKLAGFELVVVLRETVPWLRSVNYEHLTDIIDELYT